jgi:hypothetical protein
MTQAVGLPIYRSVLEEELRSERLDSTSRMVRPPINVPTVVDNLWEWVRPSDCFPNRRSSVFASPQPGLAEQHGPERGRVYRIALRGTHKICQLKGYRNSKDHPECKVLPIFLYDKLGSDWIKGSLTLKQDAGRLWLPCLARPDVDLLFDEVPVLRDLREELRERIRYWEDVRLLDPAAPLIDPEGELFFEAPDGYDLVPLTEQELASSRP